MLFNSLHFLVFLPIVFIVFWWAPQRWRSTIVLVASFYFYGVSGIRNMVLLLLSIAITHVAVWAMVVYASKVSRVRIIGYSGIALILGLLVAYKYYGFFSREWNSLGWLQIREWNPVLPVGISFFTFQAIAYLLETSRQPQALGSVRLFDTSLYLSFFPQHIAGPIERPKHLMPQLESLRRSSYDSRDFLLGLNLIVWGFFKKLFVADRLAIYVNGIYRDLPANLERPLTLVIASLFFSFQIYCDFSGYTDIARGCARFFGISILQNFDRPYAALTIVEFWRKWHITLSSWFRDYVFLPLGGSRVSRVLRLRNIWVVFLLSGLWHGANWTFLLWGAIHATFYCLFLILEPLADRMSRLSLGRAFLRLVTFSLVTLAWIPFRAPDIQSTWIVIRRVFSFVCSPSLLSVKTEILAHDARLGLMALVCLLLLEPIAMKSQNENSGGPSWVASWLPIRMIVFWASLIALIFIGGVLDANSFIYFQF